MNHESESTLKFFISFYYFILNNENFVLGFYFFVQFNHDEDLKKV